MQQTLLVLSSQLFMQHAFAGGLGSQIAAFRAVGITGTSLLLGTNQGTHPLLLLRQAGGQGTAIFVRQILHTAGKAIPILAGLTHVSLDTASTVAGASRRTNRAGLFPTWTLEFRRLNRHRLLERMAEKGAKTSFFRLGMLRGGCRTCGCRFGGKRWVWRPSAGVSDVRRRTAGTVAHR